jgi:hypothetical protein
MALAEVVSRTVVLVIRKRRLTSAPAAAII